MPRIDRNKLARRWKRLKRQGHTKWILPGAGLLVVGVALIAMLQLADARREISLAKSSLETARLAVSTRDVEGATEALDGAEARLRSAAKKADSLPLALLKPFPLIGSPAKAISDGAKAGQETVAAGRILAAAADSLPTSGATKLDGRDLSEFHTAAVNSFDALAEADQHFDAALSHLSGPAGAFIPQISKPAKEMIEVLESAGDQLDNTERSLDLLSKLTNPATDVKLLLLSQDTMEMRPTGGYIGSFGILHVANSTIRLERYDSFEALPPPNPPMAAPKELGEVITRPWDLSNSNWWPDFPTSAQNAVEMLRRQGGGEVDGVIALNEEVMARLIGVLGGINVPGYDKPVTEEGFAQRVLYEVELKRPQDVPRKKFLTLLANEVFHGLFELPGDKVPALADAFSRSAATGSLQMWFKDPSWQLGITGTSLEGALPVPMAGEDFLYLTEANMTAGKANADLTREVRYSVRPTDEGLLARVEIDYLNSGPESIVNPYYNGRLWLYVPQGSQLVNEEGGLTSDPTDPYAVITDTVFVDPNGGRQSLAFEYLLPDTVAADGHYHLTWLRQPGMSRDVLSADVGGRSFEPADDSHRFVIDASLKEEERGLARLLPG